MILKFEKSGSDIVYKTVNIYLFEFTDTDNVSLTTNTGPTLY